MTRRRGRYVGTGDGTWRGQWFDYVPSPADRVLAVRVGQKVLERVQARGRTSSGSWGGSYEPRASWYESGFLGEVAALRPFDSGPDLDAWEGRGWFGATDYHGLEVRTTSQWQLYGFARAGKDGAGLAGWRITAKDRGRIIVAVVEREDRYRVMGYAREADVPRLAVPLGSILAVLEPPDLRSLEELVP